MYRCEYTTGIIALGSGLDTNKALGEPIVYERKWCINWFVVVANSNLNCVGSFC